MTSLLLSMRDSLLMIRSLRILLGIEMGSQSPAHRGEFRGQGPNPAACLPACQGVELPWSSGAWRMQHGWRAALTCAQVGAHGRDGVHKPRHHLCAAAGADLNAVAHDKGPRDVLSRSHTLLTVAFTISPKCWTTHQVHDKLVVQVAEAAPGLAQR